MKIDFLVGELRPLLWLLDLGKTHPTAGFLHRTSRKMQSFLGGAVGSDLVLLLYCTYTLYFPFYTFYAPSFFCIINLDEWIRSWIFRPRAMCSKPPYHAFLSKSFFFPWKDNLNEEKNNIKRGQQWCFFYFKTIS